MFVASEDAIGEYSTSGATVNVSLVPGAANGVGAIAVSGSDLFVGTFGTVESSTGLFNGTIGEYTTSGATVNAELVVPGVSGPTAIAVSGSDLFVTNQLTGTIGEYTASGATVNDTLISGLRLPDRHSRLRIGPFCRGRN